MADEEKKVDEVQETAPDQVELVGEAEKAQAAAVEALPKVEKAAVPQAAKTDAKPSKLPKGYKPRLKADYEDRIVKAMTEKFGYKNRLEVPKLEKIVINMGVGRATQQPSLLEGAVADLTRIAGQKPIVTKATSKVGLAEKYNNLAGQGAQLGLVDAKQAKIENYVTQKTLDGLFLMIAEQEKAIRKDPVGSATGMAQKVFGLLGK